MIKSIQELGDHIRVKWPSAIVELTLFDMGGAMLDIKLNRQFYVLEYQPSWHLKLGVSRVRNEDLFELGHDKLFGTVAQAQEYLFMIIGDDLSKGRVG